MSWQKELAIEAFVVLLIALWFGKSFVGTIFSWMLTLGWVVLIAVLLAMILSVAIPMILAHKKKNKQD